MLPPDWIQVLHFLSGFEVCPENIVFRRHMILTFPAVGDANSVYYLVLITWLTDVCKHVHC